MKHTAYIELNDGIIQLYYRDNDIKRLRGYRILALDGSRIILPKSRAIKEAFGAKGISNHTGKDLGEYSSALYQSCYDVLNQMAVHSILTDGTAYEVDLVEEMLPALEAQDLLLFDRGYASYSLMAT